MVAAFPVRFPDQLRQHLRALRKRHDLTQAQLGALIGVSQARIAEIEANPGLVNFEQLMEVAVRAGCLADPAGRSGRAGRHPRPCGQGLEAESHRATAQDSRQTA